MVVAACGAVGSCDRLFCSNDSDLVLGVAGMVSLLLTSLSQLRGTEMVMGLYQWLWSVIG